MKIKNYLNISKEEVDAKKRNIFIPLCLGNKFFFENGALNQNIIDYLDWALSVTKSKILFIVVDRIQDTNFFVRNNSKTERACIDRVLRDGDVIKASVIKLIESLPKDKYEKVEVIKWEDYQKSDPFWAHITQTVYKEFKNNPDFRDAILHCVKTSVTDRKFSEESYLRLCDYVLDEFCLAYSGLLYKNTHFGLYVYPYSDSVLELIERIKRGETFPRLQKKLPDIKTGVILMN